ncbi:hypothetical protein ACNQGP_07195 [Flavobacterium sp. GT2N3]|uniref:hypothetical protein n=1 Tax=unclassified Flavobacterium TaxID=196869 RepID=UPI003AAAA6BB
MSDSVSKKTEINQYLINEINIEIFNKIKKEDHVFKEDLVFFNNLFNDFTFFKTNSNNYSNLYSYFKVNNIVNNSRLRFDISNHEHLSPDNFEKELLFIRYQLGFYESLLLLVNNEYDVEKRNGVLKQSIGLIGKLIESYTFCQDRIFDIFHNIDMVDSFESLIEIVEDIEDIDERIEFVHKAKHKYLECVDYFIINENDIPFDIRCDSEIKKLKELKKHLDSGYFTVTNSSQQSGAVKLDAVIKELHKTIFKSNAFEVFEKYHSSKNLAENSKTELSLLFQLFTNDGLFLETIELKHYIKWLNRTYGYDLTELKKINIESKPNIQKANDYKEYKSTTLK